MLKVLFYSHTGTVSGAENMLLLALRRMDRSRFSMSAICPEGELNRRIAELDIPCASVCPFEPRFTLRLGLLLSYFRTFAATLRDLRAHAAKVDPDIIHANSIRAGLAATAATCGMKIPVIWHLQDELPQHPFSTLIRLFALISKRVRLIAASAATGNRFRGSVPQAITRSPLKVIYNVVELEKFKPSPEGRERLRSEFGLSDPDFVIGIVGQITPRKGQLELVRAFAAMRKEGVKAKLLIVGGALFNNDGLYLDELKMAVKDLDIEREVCFTGNRPDVAMIMHALDVLAVNSKSEAFVIVALEAMACGTPVVATEVGGIREMIEHGVNGLLYPAGDEAALIQTLRHLYESPETLAAFSLEGKRVVAERFHAERYISEIEDFFSEAAASPVEREGRLMSEHSF